MCVIPPSVYVDPNETGFMENGEHDQQKLEEYSKNLQDINTVLQNSENDKRNSKPNKKKSKSEADEPKKKNAAAELDELLEGKGFIL